MQSVTAKFDNKVGSPTGFTAAIHTASSGSPADSATCALSGSAPDTAGEYAYTPSATCSLSDSTTYFLVLSATGTGGNYYQWKLTSSSSETNAPSNAGWAIADKGKFSNNGGNWNDSNNPRAPMFKVTATPKVRAYLTASGITDTTATLNITNPYGTWWRQWWYQRTTPSGDDTCHSVAAGTATASLSNLNASTPYTYKAYDASGCNSADEIASVTFATTPTPGSRDSSKDFDTLSAAGNNAPDGVWSDDTTMWVSDGFRQQGVCLHPGDQSPRHRQGHQLFRSYRSDFPGVGRHDHVDRGRANHRQAVRLHHLQ